MPSTADYYPPPAFFYRVRFQGDSAKNDMSFREASGLSVAIEPERVVEGGNNQFAHRLPTTPTYSNLVLKRGFMLQELPLYQWCRTTMAGNFARAIKPKQITVSLLTREDQDVKPLKSWLLYGAWPVKWTLGDMHSEQNEILVESLEFTYDYFEIDA